MKYIKKYVDQINDELKSAKEYAEKSIELKAAADVTGSTTDAAVYRSMATDELNHAMELHRIVAEEIARLNKIYTAPEDMREIWNKSHAEYIERAAWIKQMLSM